jgi:hypothetical protein
MARLPYRSGFAVAGVVIGSGLIVLPASATVLTFDLTPDNHFESFESTHAAYGDRVTAPVMLVGGETYGYGVPAGTETPNVEVDYAHNELFANELGNVLHNTANGWLDSVDYLHYADGSTFWITFTPDAGYGVTLESFVIDLYVNGGAGGVTFNWAVRQDNTGGAILDSGTETGIFVGVDPVVSPNVSYNGPLVLEMSFSNTLNNGIVGVDDVTFTQYLVPEPASLSLLMAGSAMMLRRRHA